MKPVIEVEDLQGSPVTVGEAVESSCSRTRWQARLKSNPAIQELSSSKESAIRELLITLRTHEMSDNREDYQIEEV